MRYYFFDWNYLLKQIGTTSLYKVNRADLNLYWNYYKYYFNNWKLASDYLIQDLFFLLYKWEKPTLKDENKAKSERIKNLIRKMKTLIEKIGEKNIDKIREKARLNIRATVMFIEEFFKNLNNKQNVEEAVAGALAKVEEILIDFEKYRNKLKEIFGSSEQGLNTFLNDRTILELANDTRIREILDLIDKYYEGEIFTSKTGIETEGYFGIKFSNELPPFPSEIILEELLPNYLTVKFLKNELMNYEKEKLAEVPALVFIVDESGSMEGLKIDMAKALFLKLASLCFKNRKPVIYIGFSDKAKTRLKITDYSILYKNDSFSDMFLDTLVSFMNGGTNFANAINQLISELNKTKINDYEIVFITDGGDSNTRMPEGFKELKPLYLILLDDTYNELVKREHWILTNMKNYVNNYIDAYHDLKQLFKFSK
ncbi:MAG: vWA domain-containing protein [Candidatus Aenigmatarchaeota archaeon]